MKLRMKQWLTGSSVDSLLVPAGAAVQRSFVSLSDHFLKLICKRREDCELVVDSPLSGIEGASSPLGDLDSSLVLMLVGDTGVGGSDLGCLD